MTEQTHVMFLNSLYGSGPQRRQGNGLRLFVDTNSYASPPAPWLASQLFPFQVCIGTDALFSAPLIQEPDSLAVEPVWQSAVYAPCPQMEPNS